MRRQSIILRELGSMNFHPDYPVYLSGEGSDSILRQLLGLAPSTEIYRINGLAVNELSHREFDQYRLNMGHSFESGGLINNQTLYENFQMLLDYHDFLDPQVRFHHIVKMMELFNIDKVKHLRPAHVTPAVRKAASVLRAFLLRPEMIILDKPTLGLSNELVPVLVDLIHEHQVRWNLKHVIIISDDREFMELLPGKDLVHGRAA